MAWYSNVVFMQCHVTELIIVFCDWIAMIPLITKGFVLIVMADQGDCACIMLKLCFIGKY